MNRTFIALFLALLWTAVYASPYHLYEEDRIDAGLLETRWAGDPYFDPNIPSCPICEKAWPSISNCAEAAPVLANFSEIIWDPSAFLSIIECSCSDTFQSAYPQCVDCFQNTNQTYILTNQTDGLPSIVSGMRTVCGMLSVLGGDTACVNGQAPVNPSQGCTPSASLAAMSSAASSPLTGSLLSMGLVTLMAFFVGVGLVL